MSVDCIRVPAAELLTAGNVVQMSAHQPRMPNLARQGKRFLQLVCPAESLLNCCRQDGELLPPEDACLLLREFCQARH